jgi:hypothetical protein
MAGLNNRGARDSLLTGRDGLAGLEDATTSAVPQILRRCAVHDTGLPVMPASRRELAAAGLEPREGRRNRGGLVGTRLFGSAAEEGGDHWWEVRRRVRVTGRPARHTAGFVAEPGQLGYTENSAARCS